MYSSTVLNPQVSQLAGQLASAMQALVGQMGGVASRSASIRTSSSTSSRTVTSSAAVEEKQAREHEQACSNLIKELGIDRLETTNLHSVFPLLDPCHVKPAPSSANPLPSHWKPTYTSTDSFFENRYGMSEKEMLHGNLHSRKGGLLLATGLLGRIHNGQLYTIPARGFKTKRATTGRELKDPSARLKTLVIDALKDNPKGASSSNSSTGPYASDLPQSLIDDPNLSAKDREKLQVAFSEGYMASQHQTGGKAPRPRGAVFYPLFLIITGFVVFSMFSGMGRDLFGQDLKSSLMRRPFETQPESVTVTFDDVQGVDEAKEELQDVVEFLRSPDKYQAMGARLPKGVLLVGPPGIGKTLLARAVAGEAQVPFFHASGSEFDEMFVGTGARRVRQLFESAKAHAPCVIFLDEIDSVGAKRTSSQMHPYANQTINQLLSEMDGFRPTEGIIVLGATNRKDNLDKAILRPGRFDVEITVSPPDLKGRIDILNLYLKKIRHTGELKVQKLARGTIGFSGADLQNLVNQAALQAAKEGAQMVTMTHLEFARDKLLMGPEKKNRVPDHETNLNTAYHEAGHALVAYFNKDGNQLNKITIMPRGSSLGHTSFIPEKEVYQTTQAQLLAEIDTLMGGRVAEEIINGKEFVTTGASSDIQRATAIATAMVKQYGMSSKIGPRVIGDKHSSIDGMNIMAGQEASEHTTSVVDSEIKRILDESYERARVVLTTHSEEHKALAQALMVHETLDAADVKSIVEDKKMPALPSDKPKSPPKTGILGDLVRGRQKDH